ncbi:MAG: 3-keto-disaccharide hydrolase [Flavicella sp.]
MKRSFLLFTLVVISCSTPSKKSTSTDWKSVFDGKSFNNWSVVSSDLEKSKSFWSIENGVIHCKSDEKNHPGSWLVFEQSLGDFEFKLKFKSNDSLKGNSGLQFRSKLDLAQNKMQGPQIDIHPPKPFRTGLLYDETDGVKHWLYPLTSSWKLESYPTPENWEYHSGKDQWNELYLFCKGTKIITKLNGVKLVDFDGNRVLNDSVHKNMGVGMNGKLSIQLHKKHIIDISFKDLYLKKL